MSHNNKSLVLSFGKTVMQTLSLGISPCPNDTFIFHALLSGLVASPENLHVRMHDVEKLNILATEGVLDISKLSIGVLPLVLNEYALLRSGAALGFGVGPLVVAREPLDIEACRHASVAIPGRLTTANALLELHGSFCGARHEMLFDQIMPALIRGECQCGVIIHEGRFTYERYGLHKVLDLGQWWESRMRMPLPLGVIVARRSLGAKRIAELEAAIGDSLRHARKSPTDCMDFVRSHAQEMNDEVIASHIATFVTDFSLELGAEGESAVRMLAQKSAELMDVALPELFA